MTIDWFVLLTPMVLLVAVLPFLFVGCTSFKTAEGETTTPVPPAGGPQPPGTAPTTTFRLEMDANLQVPGVSPVVKIEVSWSLDSSAAPPAPPPLTVPQQPVVITSRKVPPPVPPAIDAATDPGAVFEIRSADVGLRDRVRCLCKVSLADGTSPNVAGTNNRATLTRDATHEFRIRARPQQGGFQVYFNGV